MAGSIFGKQFCISTWGESHGKGIGVVIDGCPAGLPLSEEDIQKYLDRRRPGQSQFTTSRNEGDRAEILSGVFEGRTTGTPISILVANTSQRSQDYSEIASYYRPGHADYTFDQKYGFRDYRGGGRSSGRETIGRVAAGAVAAKLLSEVGISLSAYTRSIGPAEIDYDRFDEHEIRRNPVYMPDSQAAEQAMIYLKECMREKDSVGGVVECVVRGLPAGLGDPCFDKLDANLAKAILSVGAVPVLGRRSFGGARTMIPLSTEEKALKKSATTQAAPWAESATEALWCCGQPSSRPPQSRQSSIRSIRPEKT